MLKQPVSAENSSWSTGIEASASISGAGGDDQEMVITIRKRVQDITVRPSSTYPEVSWSHSINVAWHHLSKDLGLSSSNRTKVKRSRSLNGPVLQPPELMHYIVR